MICKEADSACDGNALAESLGWTKIVYHSSMFPRMMPLPGGALLLVLLQATSSFSMIALDHPIPQDRKMPSTHKCRQRKEAQLLRDSGGIYDKKSNHGDGYLGCM